MQSLPANPANGALGEHWGLWALWGGLLWAVESASTSSAGGRARGGDIYIARRPYYHIPFFFETHLTLVCSIISSEYVLRAYCLLEASTEGGFYSVNAVCSFTDRMQLIFSPPVGV